MNVPCDSPPEKLTIIQVPQANRPERVVELVCEVHRYEVAGHQMSVKDLADRGFDERDIEYYRNAACILGFLNDDFSLTPLGRLLVSLESTLQYQRVAFAFEDSTVGRAWIAWSGVKELADVDPLSAKAFLLEMAEGAAESTMGRRIQTLRVWALAFRKWRGGPPEQGRLDFRPRGDRHPEFRTTSLVFHAGGSGEAISRLAPGSKKVRIATAFFTLQGYQLLGSHLAQAELYLLLGQDERNPVARHSRAEAERLLMWFKESLELGAPDIAKSAAIKKLHAEILNTRLSLRHFEPRSLKGLHAKGYIFDEEAALVGSANLTRNGLVNNVEIGHVTFDSSEIQFYRQHFDDHFAEATPITLPILKILEQSSAFKEPITPFMFFLKVMHELIDRIPDLHKRGSYKLAEFQRPVVHVVLFKLLANRGVLFISPTGTGKTIMGSFVAAKLCEEKLVEHIIVVCPNPAIGIQWRRVLRGFGRPVDIITHGDLRLIGSQPNVVSTLRLRHIIEIINNTRANDLIIVDECHHFRNMDSVGAVMLKKLLRHGESGERPYCLLLTATPISTGIENLRALVSLISTEQVDALTSIKDLQGVANVTLRDILARFGSKVPRKGPRALKFGDEYRCFPSMKIQTLLYKSSMSEAFDIIADLPLVFRHSNKELARLIDATEEELAVGRHRAFLRGILARRAESSPAALQCTVERLLEGITSGRLEPVHRQALEDGLTMLLSRICSPDEDQKLAELTQIVRSLKPRQKLLIFSEWTETIEYLFSELGQRFKKRRMESLSSEKSAGNRERILRLFAPEAQEGSPGDFDSRLDIIIATDAIAEGRNIQDASAIVNYDLSWTPLRLVQRIGRVDRPTERPRKVRVWNFYPGNERYDQITGLWERLERRSSDVEEVSAASPIGDSERVLEQFEHNDAQALKSLYEHNNFDEFLAKALPTSKLLSALFEASPEEKRLAKELHDNCRAGRSGVTPGCYVLIRHDGKRYSVFYDSTTDTLRTAPHQIWHETLIDNHVCATRDVPSVPPASQFESQLNYLLRRWSQEQGIELDEIVVVGAETISHISSNACDQAG